jgi:hypothetical protein
MKRLAVLAAAVVLTIAATGTFTSPPSNALNILWADYCGRVTDPACATPTPLPTPAPTASPTVAPVSLPIRAAFYYPWFPEAWNQQGLNPFSHYTPSLGYYDTSAVVGQHVTAMQSAGIQAGIASWWGQGTPTDGRIPTLLSSAGNFRWALYYEPEGTGNPTSATIGADLAYISAHYASNPAYLHVNGKPVIFVYGDGTDGCGMADRWKAVDSAFYVVLKVFAGYKTCASQPDSWHQYAPAVAEDHQTGYSFSISPGFWKANEATPRLTRDATRWQTNVRDMVSSNEPWQLVATWDEFGEGSQVEDTTQLGTTYRTVLGGSTAPSVGPSPVPSATTSPPPVATPTPTPTPTTTGTSDPVIAAAGDIACDPAVNTGAPANCDQSATAQQVIALNPTAVLTLGDNQYESNTASQYAAVFNPTWGAFKSKIKPAIGNHEYLTANASGYFGYFGSAAGDPAKGYYSYDLGAWHLISLNSECSHIGGCSSGNPEEAWLRADLAAHPNACTLAYWHEPRFSSGQHGNATQMTTIWNDLVAAHADVVLSGHNHDYERFPALNATGVPTASGVQEFVVGTGGKNHYGFGTAPAFSGEVRNDTAFGDPQADAPPRLLRLAVPPRARLYVHR